MNEINRRETLAEYIHGEGCHDFRHGALHDDPSCVEDTSVASFATTRR